MDLQPYICPVNGHKFRLVGLGDENCQSVLAADGWIDFHKNRHRETFRFDNDYIYRGEDTSMISKDGQNPVGTYYILYDDDGNEYGSKWIKRNMSVGETYDRDPVVKIFEYSGRLITRYPDPTRILFRNYYAEYSFPSGIVLHDVIGLLWAGEEEYLYAKGYGLVGWKNIRTNKEGSYIGHLDGSTMQTFPIPTPRPKAPVNRTVSLTAPRNAILWELVERLT